MKHVFDAIVIGGGLAGLTVATLLARSGKSVALLEKSAHTGGRAITDRQNGFRMNLGPHALYKNGAAFRILQELGIQFKGQSPTGKYGYAIKRGRLHRLPYNASTLISTDLFQSWNAKFEVLTFFRKLPRIDVDSIQDLSLENWLTRTFQHQEVRDFISMIIRVSTYANDAERVSAGAAIGQLQLGRAGNVLYLDGGWQVLVDGVRNAAEQAGASIVPQARALSINNHAGGYGVHTATEVYLAQNIVLAIGPREVAELMSLDSSLTQITQRRIPVKMAALTVGLKSLPSSKTLLAFGIESPLYFSVHSKWAQLAKEKGAALIHTGKYLTPGQSSDPELDRAELEELLNLCQPGWKDQLVAYSYLPQMKVANAEVTATGNGMHERPPVQVPGRKGIYLCGDWIGDRGMLCDASLASAKTVADNIIQTAQDAINSTQEFREVVRSA